MFKGWKSELACARAMSAKDSNLRRILLATDGGLQADFAFRCKYVRSFPTWNFDQTLLSVLFTLDCHKSYHPYSVGLETMHLTWRIIK